MLKSRIFPASVAVLTAVLLVGSSTVWAQSKTAPTPQDQQRLQQQRLEQQKKALEQQQLKQQQQKQALEQQKIKQQQEQQRRVQEQQRLKQQQEQQRKALEQQKLKQQQEQQKKAQEQQRLKQQQEQQRKALEQQRLKQQQEQQKKAQEQQRLKQQQEQKKAQMQGKPGEPKVKPPLQETKPPMKSDAPEAKSLAQPPGFKMRPPPPGASPEVQKKHQDNERSLYLRRLQSSQAQAERRGDAKGAKAIEQQIKQHEQKWGLKAPSAGKIGDLQPPKQQTGSPAVKLPPSQATVPEVSRLEKAKEQMAEGYRKEWSKLANEKTQAEIAGDHQKAKALLEQRKQLEKKWGQESKAYQKQIDAAKSKQPGAGPPDLTRSGQTAMPPGAGTGKGKDQQGSPPAGLSQSQIQAQKDKIWQDWKAKEAKAKSSEEWWNARNEYFNKMKGLEKMEAAAKGGKTPPAPKTASPKAGSGPTPPATTTAASPAAPGQLPTPKTMVTTPPAATPAAGKTAGPAASTTASTTYGPGQESPAEIHDTGGKAPQSLFLNEAQVKAKKEMLKDNPYGFHEIKTKDGKVIDVVANPKPPDPSDPQKKQIEEGPPTGYVTIGKGKDAQTTAIQYKEGTFDKGGKPTYGVSSDVLSKKEYPSVNEQIDAIRKKQQEAFERDRLEAEKAMQAWGNATDKSAELQAQRLLSEKAAQQDKNFYEFEKQIQQLDPNYKPQIPLSLQREMEQQKK